MEVVAATPGGGGVPPFHDHDVREWSRIDSLTGVLERARLETDHWTANTNNARHNYNKVVDSRARTNADGALQQKARRQLEVYQSQIPGGHLQVIKTHTVSSSRWTNKSSITAHSNLNDKEITQDFENLQLSLNPLDLSSQKSKANVGRTVGRRPPSRPRAREDTTTNPLRNIEQTAATNLYRVSRLCHQIHDNAVKQTFGKYHKPLTPEKRESGDGSIEIYEIESVSSSNDYDKKTSNGHSKLSRTKSTSSEDLLTTPEKDKSTKSIEDLEDLEQLQSWRRTSKIRRSLQYPTKQTNNNNSSKPLDLPENSVSVRKIREELEKGRRLNTALRGNNVDLEALDQILQSISSSSSNSSTQSDKASTIDGDNPEEEGEEDESNKKQKRNSFITVESLKEVRGRLRRTSSPTSDIYKTNNNNNNNNSKEEETDDGIVTEETKPDEIMPVSEKTQQSRVRSYVYGMENMFNNKKKSNLGTGSLESRTKLLNGNSNNRNEDWYNRRKSYGFEQVHNHNESASSILLKNRIESSTDSGICRSSEIMIVPTSTKITENYNTNTTFSSDKDSSSSGGVRKISSIFGQTGDEDYPNRSALQWNKRVNDWKTKSDSNSTTITIPIVSGHNFSDTSWNDVPEKDSSVKRHSIAVDESKYVNNNTNVNNKRTSLAINEKFSNQQPFDDDFSQNRRSKKVEFCKTEVHFAAESGKVNIVETDEKPPPTNNFRRRRRNSGPLCDLINDFNSDLPVLHFGDSSYEKSLLGVTNDELENNKLNIDGVTSCDESNEIYQNVSLKNSVTIPFGTVTVNTNYNTNQIDVQDDDKKDNCMYENENIKGILKNKPIKPKPYHLGLDVPLFNYNSDDDNNKWGVKLKPIQKIETSPPPIWKSTITLQNTVYNNGTNDDSYQENQTEFQRLLKNLKPITKKPDLICDQNGSTTDNFNSIKIVSPIKDKWTMANQFSNDDNRWIEHKLYSTKVNFGDGEATVVRNDNFSEKDKHTTWPKTDNAFKDSKQILNKGLVVRIGREDFTTSKHTVCSKTTTNQDSSNTTTTKITIDLSPSPTHNNLPLTGPASTNTYHQRSQTHHSFKSTSLILNTIKNDNKLFTSNNAIPNELEALKKLYEDIQSDSDADKEVQLLMDNNSSKENDNFEDDNSSVVSGSWSKMRAYKTLNSMNVLKGCKINAKVEKGGEGKYGHVSDIFKNTNETSLTTNPEQKRSKSKLNDYKFSPVSARKTVPPQSKRTSEINNKLSSPSLVGKNSDKITNNEPIKIEISNKRQEEFKNVSDRKLQEKYNSSDIVLRQPKKSEMTYFGVNVSPKPVKKVSETTVIRNNNSNKLSDKPDLLQHMKTSSKTTANVVSTSKTKLRKSLSPADKRQRSDTSSPIYENIDKTKPKTTTKSRYGREFDNSILEELTKAADQILQAVNGFADDDTQNSRLSADDLKKEQLSTITESKSWKQGESKSKTVTKQNETKTKLKYTSSTASSIESVSRGDHRRITPPVRRSATTTAHQTKVPPERLKKKSLTTTSETTTTTKSNTKARRLQRASSREALLQSHGSSSEDLAANNEVQPVRKPRQIKKTKALQLTVTNGLDISKKHPPTAPHRKRDEKRTDGPEIIQHKTAVSTIRSTKERTMRDRSKSRRDSKSPSKKDGTKGLSSSKTTTDLKKNLSSRETVNHRISTANIKKCHRADRH